MFLVEELIVNNQGFRAGSFNFELKPGECALVAGENGSGKTTLFLGLWGIIPHKAKTISWKNQNLLNISPQKRPISLLFQKYNLFPHLTVAENIAFVLKHRFGNSYMEKTRIEAIKRSYRLEQIWNKKPTSLSGGEYQRAALARTLCWDPDIILLDEPFTALDAEWQKELEILIYTLKSKNKIIFFSSHQPEKSIGLCDQVLLLKKGQVTFYGKTSEAIEQLKIIPFQSSLENIYRIQRVENSGDITIIHIHPEVRVYSSRIIPPDARYIKINPSDILLSSQKTETSALNQLKGTIVSIELIQNLVKVTLDVGIPISTYITRQSWQEKHFQVGEEVYAIFKASHVECFSWNFTQ